MTELRRWKADEKLALINEIRERGRLLRHAENMVWTHQCSTAEKRYSIYIESIASDREQGIPVRA